MWLTCAITKRHDIIDAIVNSHTSNSSEQLKAARSSFQLFSESEEFMKGITEALNRVINTSAQLKVMQWRNF